MAAARTGGAALEAILEVLRPEWFSESPGPAAGPGAPEGRGSGPAGEATILAAVRAAPALIEAAAAVVARGPSPGSAAGLPAILVGRDEPEADAVLAILAVEDGPAAGLAAEAILARRLRRHDRQTRPGGDEMLRRRLAAAWSTGRSPALLAAIAVLDGQRLPSSRPAPDRGGGGGGRGGPATLRGTAGDDDMTREEPPASVPAAEALAEALASARGDRRRPPSVEPARDVLTPSGGSGRDARALDVALGSVLERLPRPLTQRAGLPNLLRWIPHPRLGRSALRHLASVREAGDRSTVLADGHLLRLPRWRDALRGLARPARCRPDAAVVADLSSPAARAAVVLVAALPIGRPAAIEGLRRLAEHRDPVARWRVAVELADLPVRSTGPDLAGLAADQQPGCRAAARRAARRLRRAGAGEALDRRLATGAGAAVSRAARRRLLPEVDTDATGAGERSPAARTAAAHRLGRVAAVERDRSVVVADLTDRITRTTDDRSSRVTAIGEAIRLGLVAAAGEAVVEALEDSDARVAATAAAALAHAGRQAVDAPLRRALGHADPRVRSNALEALDRRGATRIEDIMPLGNSAHARERASAAVALAAHHLETAVRLAATMLRDRRDAHRLAGLHAARCLRDARLRPVLQEMVRNDPRPGIRWWATATEAALRTARPRTVDADGAATRPAIARSGSPGIVVEGRPVGPTVPSAAHRAVSEAATGAAGESASSAASNAASSAAANPATNPATEPAPEAPPRTVAAPRPAPARLHRSDEAAAFVAAALAVPGAPDS